jgi:hypothetical protein
MKKILLILLATAICCSLSSCFAELVSEEVVEVDAVITKVRRRAGSANPPRPVDRDIYFEYDGIKGSWDVNAEIYNFYKGKEGEVIKCYLITRVYDDGTTRQKLVAVDDYDGR